MRAARGFARGAAAALAALALTLTADARNRPSQPLPAAPFLARVSAVYDGDTLVATTARGEVTVRIAAIDAPESDQPGGREARAHLAALVCHRSVRISAQKVDPFGRLVAHVEVDGVDVGLEQIDAGHAWHFRRYAGEQAQAQRSAYQQAEAHARAGSAGLWSRGDPEAPWAYRERQRRVRGDAGVEASGDASGGNSRGRSGGGSGDASGGRLGASPSAQGTARVRAAC